jgi:hypothetical protein
VDIYAGTTKVIQLTAASFSHETGNATFAGNVLINDDLTVGRGTKSDSVGSGYCIMWGGDSGGSDRWGFRVKTSTYNENLCLDANLAGTPHQVLEIDKLNGNATFGGKITVSANVAGDYGAFINNSNSGGYGLRIAGGASSADYLIRGQNEGGTDKFVVKSDGSATFTGDVVMPTWNGKADGYGAASRRWTRTVHANAANDLTTVLLRYSRYWWGEGNFMIYVRENYYGPDSGNGIFYINGTTRDSLPSVVTIHNNGVAAPFATNYNSSGEWCDISITCGYYRQYNIIVDVERSVYHSSDSSVGANNAYHVYSMTEII